LKRRVAERGWTIVHLDGSDGRGPTWAYTVGFWEFAGAPEIILFGHDELWSNGLLSQAAKQLQAGMTLKDNTPWSLDGFEGTWRRVDPTHVQGEEWFNCARRYRRERTGGETFDAFQPVVPDGSGKYPWDDGFDEKLRPFQRELYLSTPQPGPGELAHRDRL
jgi:hypothetical protein